MLLEFIPLHHVILPNALPCSYELNTLDADRSRSMCGCRIVSIYLLRMWCLYTWSCLDILITMHFSINCSTVICSPTVILMLSWEKPLVKPMAPRVYVLSYKFSIYFYLHLYFPIYIIKISKILILSYYLYQILVSQVLGEISPD